MAKKTQIDCYGFEASSAFFKRANLSAYLIKNVDGTVYVSYSAGPVGPIHRIDQAEDGSMRIMWSYGTWEEAELLEYVPINETLNVELPEE